MSLARYTFVVHADWSVTPAKRWRASARRTGEGWRIEAARQVGPAETFLADMRAEAAGGTALVGADLPLGVPLAWAEKAGVDNFPAALRRFGEGPWRDFFRPAAARSEISLRRPFYPAAPGGRLQSHLTEALGVANMDALRRRCDFDETGARAATPLFWTLGGAQVGKAALTFWRDALQPALDAPFLALWPFAGALQELGKNGGVVLAETYPGEVYDWLDLDLRRARRGKLRRSKRRQGDRALEADRLHAAGRSVNGRFDADASRQIVEGFPEGEDDAFDAMVGLLGLLLTLEGARPENLPDDPAVRSVEGWIMGRAAGPRVSNGAAP